MAYAHGGVQDACCVLDIQNLSKAFGQRQALSALTLRLESGEVYGLLGPNGAGKTTTINLLSGLLRPDHGQVLIAGQPAAESTKPYLGIMPQQNLLYQSLTCGENLAFFAKIYGLESTARSQRIQTCLTAVNLQDRVNSVVGSLSGGMQRRLSLAIAIVHQPKLVVLDEPTTGLDIEARYEVWDLIRQLKQQGVTVLLTTHLLDEAERLCDRIGFLKQGCLLAQGSLPELRSHIPAEEVVILQTADEEAAIAQAANHGFTMRRYDTHLAFWIPERLELRELIAKFDGIPIDSIARSPVTLEHIYLEVTRSV
ncbi:ABC transporter ATP-binding protein [Leptothoe sp. ISB3NOV94-8A]|uniref:ABC transporter ATP-binding protein n=1 Tax=Adonisia turfae TaxID=2950184 RepID=UPI002029A95F|nr:ABC transporter ATP-binding protein [Adonisia turfae]MDV3352301.1 ABC transporter ATP-binding protein [Leptothoe sp. LEGE 181152]